MSPSFWASGGANNWQASNDPSLAVRHYKFYAQPSITVTISSSTTSVFQYHPRVLYTWGVPVTVHDWSRGYPPMVQNLQELYVDVYGDIDDSVLAALQEHLFPNLSFDEILQALEENCQGGNFTPPKAIATAPTPEPTPEENATKFDEAVLKRLQFLKHLVETTDNYADDTAPLSPPSDE